MAVAVVAIALKTLGDLLLEEGRLLFGVSDEVKALETQLREIECLLKDADRRQHEHESVRNWIVQIRNLAYRAEDVIAAYAVQISSHGRVRGLKRLLRRLPRVLNCYSLHQIGSEILNIKSELVRITKNMSGYGIRIIFDGAGNLAANDNQNWVRRAFPNFEMGDCFVGKEAELKQLVSLVVDDKKNRVISVLGMGGIGKTTIAKKVYNHMIQTKSFDCFAWVCITQQCQIQSVLEGVFKQLITEKGDGVSSLSEEQLIGLLCQTQRAKRCLIVLDDLWETSHWNGLKHAFIVEDLKSKILITTRKQKVAKIGFSPPLGLLNNGHAWELLMKKAFPHGNTPGIQISNDDQIIQRVLPLLLKEEKNKNDYIPKVVSVGPYHHGKQELAAVEAFKPVAVDLFISGGRENHEFFYNQDYSMYFYKIFEIIEEIRNCYEQESTANYSDDDLARMMLHDACFIIIHMETAAPAETGPPPEPTVLKIFTMMKHLGMLTAAIVLRDLFLLENQIPLRVIELLINLRYEAGEYENILHKYLNVSLFGEYRQKRVASPHEINRAEPLHLLEAFHRLVVSDCVKPKKTGCGWLCCFKDQPATPPPPPEIGGDAFTISSNPNSSHDPSKKENGVDLEIGVGDPTTFTTGNQGLILGIILKILGCKKKANNPNNDLKKFIHSFRSVTDLKAKGIYFKPSPTQSLMDVNFKSNFFYARLQLPNWCVSIYTKVFFLNMVAYELSPNSPTGGEVASYINFMKSLIERPEDVKELREKKILYNTLGSDQEVLSVYKDINTYGADNPAFFHQVKDKIQVHYKSKTKTWMAELIHTYFRSPWTIIAFLAAISLLAISAAQLHYAVHPN